MSFLSPALLAGLVAIGIPILLHLIQRERKRIVEFPSLMFLRRIPYQSVRRRRVYNWVLLLMRIAALALLVLAFSRPFFRQGALATATAAGGRELVILLDRSASMGYGDHWARASAAARQAVDSLGRDDHATLVLFAQTAEEAVRSTSDRVRLLAAIDAASVGAGATEFGPALKLAQSILAGSRLPRREAVLISDFQKAGWRHGSEDVRFPEGTVLTPVSVASPGTSNISVASVMFGRARFSGEERITLTAGVANRGIDPAREVPVALEIDGHVIQTENATVPANASASVTFAPFTLSEANIRGTVRAGTDALPQDNIFYFVLTPTRPVSVLIVDAGVAERGEVESSFYLTKALAIGSSPAFETRVLPAARVSPSDLEKPAVIVLNDTTVPPAAAGGTIERLVERGGGLLIALGERSERSGWPSADAALLPGKLGEVVDRAAARGGTLGFLDYSHPVFELFKAPHSGDFSGARMFRYRSISVDPTDRVLARYDDGMVAAAERRVGTGRIIVWSSSLDDAWNDLALKPVYLPLVHQIVRYLARYEDPAAWRTVGQAIDLTAPPLGATLDPDRIVVSPSGSHATVDTASKQRFVELEQQGFYEVRTRRTEERRPLTIAADLDPSESDLTPLDPAEFTAAVIGHAAGPAEPSAAAGALSPKDMEQRQSVWWYLLGAAILLLVSETIVSNRVAQPSAGVTARVEENVGT